jgi:hypothetical protein
LFSGTAPIRQRATVDRQNTGRGAGDKPKFPQLLDNARAFYIGWGPRGSPLRVWSSPGFWGLEPQSFAHLRSLVKLAVKLSCQLSTGRRECNPHRISAPPRPPLPRLCEASGSRSKRAYPALMALCGVEEGKELPWLPARQGALGGQLTEGERRGQDWIGLDRDKTCTPTAFSGGQQPFILRGSAGLKAAGRQTAPFQNHKPPSKKTAPSRTQPNLSRQPERAEDGHAAQVRQQSAGRLGRAGAGDAKPPRQQGGAGGGGVTG